MNQTDNQFPTNSLFDKNHPARNPVLPKTELVVGHTRKLGVVEVPVRDLEEIIHDLQRIARQMEDDDTSGWIDVEDQMDRLASYLHG